MYKSARIFARLLIEILSALYVQRSKLPFMCVSIRKMNCHLISHSLKMLETSKNKTEELRTQQWTNASSIYTPKINCLSFKNDSQKEKTTNYYMIKLLVCECDELEVKRQISNIYAGWMSSASSLFLDIRWIPIRFVMMYSNWKKEIKKYSWLLTAYNQFFSNLLNFVEFTKRYDHLWS